MDETGIHPRSGYVARHFRDALAVEDALLTDRAGLIQSWDVNIFGIR